METRITSRDNERVRRICRLLDEGSARAEAGCFVAESAKLCADIAAVLPPREVYYTEAALKKNPFLAALGGEHYLLAEHVAEKLARTRTTQGVWAVFDTPPAAAENLSGRRILALDAVQDPGNLGAVLRSADASGVDAVIVCDPLTDMYNPNLIRSSIGAIFTVPIATATSEDTIKWLKSNNIKIYTAQLQDSEWYYDTDMKGGTAIVMGTEATGLTDAWRKAADAHIKIPMLGKLDSLNVSVSAAILMFEAVRQRNS